MDRSNHASLYEAVRLSWANLKRYGHLNMGELADILERFAGKAMGVITDGVFSMEGDIAPLPEIHELTSKAGARLIVDDAHGVGVMGPGGRGTAEHFGMLDEVDVITGTFSKSFASLGGFCAGPAKLIDWIKHDGKALIYSASISPAMAGAARKALQIMRDESEHREKLMHNVTTFRNGLRELGFKVGESPTAVLPVYVGDEMRCFALWKMLLAEGVYTNPVIPPRWPRTTPSSAPPSWPATPTSSSSAAWRCSRRSGGWPSSSERARPMVPRPPGRTCQKNGENPDLIGGSSRSGGPWGRPRAMFFEDFFSIPARLENHRTDGGSFGGLSHRRAGLTFGGLLAGADLATVPLRSREVWNRPAPTAAFRCRWVHYLRHGPPQARLPTPSTDGTPGDPLRGTKIAQLIVRDPPCHGRG